MLNDKEEELFEKCLRKFETLLLENGIRLSYSNSTKFDSDDCSIEFSDFSIQYVPPIN